MRKSTSARIVHLLLAIGFTIGVASLAFFWSLGNTISFTKSVMIEDTWGTVMGLVIQLGPQVFLALAATTVGTERTGWLAAFFGLSAVDAATNIGATMSLLSSGAQMTTLQISVRIAIDIVIVFGEEMVGYGIAIVFDDLARLLEDFGEVAPQWMHITGDVASMVGTGRAPKSRKRKGRRPTPQLPKEPLDWTSIPPVRESG